MMALSTAGPRDETVEASLRLDPNEGVCVELR
jgi:hypothetical protein